jgi:predicted transcriptional regulator
MAGSGRFVITLLAGLMFLSSIPLATAQNEQPELQIILDVEQDEVYLEGDELLLNVKIVNQGEFYTISNDPSCDFYFTIFDSEENIIHNSKYNCRGQHQEISIDANSDLTLNLQTWDFKNWNSDYIKSGKYIISISHSVLDLHFQSSFMFLSNTSDDIGYLYQNNVVEIEKNNQLNSDYLILHTIYNPTDKIIQLPGEYCNLVVSTNTVRTIIDQCEEDLVHLYPNEYSFIGTTEIYSSMLNYGENFIEISLPGTQYKDSIILNHDIDVSQSLTGISGQIVIEELENRKSNALRLSLNLEQEFLEQTGDCSIYVDIINDLGELVHNQIVNVCDTLETSTNDFISTPIDLWETIDADGCQLNSGRYSIIASSKNTSGFILKSYEHIKLRHGHMCVSSEDLHIDSTIEQNLLSQHLFISTNSNILRINSPCIISIETTITQVNLSNRVVDEYCNFKPGNYFYNDYHQPSHDTPIFSIVNFIELNESLRNYDFEVNALFKSTFDLTYIIQDSYSVDRHFAIAEKKSFEANGHWQLIPNGDVNCWLLSAPNSAFILSENQDSALFQPREGWYGEYLAIKDVNNDDKCGIYSLDLILIDEVYNHEMTIEEKPKEIEYSQDEKIDLVTVTTVTVSSTSILITIILLISNTESIRIPATSAGLWMLALVGKTHETSDGRFQRGRLIGYLTANPGCHFRALMAALNMSNGQITHHLRLLENQELIWRINDGRFVRYYPLNNSLYPGMNPDDLPVPPLSPDPKSLQGKILTLLDDEHQVGEFPTQSELAKKLEKSQQLISHHLRTLQKYGLVEKRKMGIKNRYKLTKEALFLLETDIDYNKIRD